MTMDKRITSIVRGEVPNEVVWIPRMDLWYHANKASNTLSPEYADMSVDDIMEDIGGAYYKIIPDYFAAGEDSLVDRTLGIYHDVPGIPYDTVFHDVSRKVMRSGDATEVTYTTPVGSIKTSYRYTLEMLRGGVTIPWISEYAFKKEQDYAVLNFIFQNLEVVPRYDFFSAYYNRYKNKGIVVALASNGAGPFHYVLHDLMDIETFFYEMYDHPEKLEELCNCIDGYLNQIVQVAANCPAELILFGANYSEAFTPPPFFEKYILPYLQNYSRILHSRNKFLVSHCDGENKNLLKLFRISGIDVADSVCPKPMTKCTLGELQAGFGSNITIVGGIPAIVLEPDQTNEAHFINYLQETLHVIDKGRRFILGVSDNVPPGAPVSRIKAITDMVKAHNKSLSV